jgi:hypothetical protein
MSFVWWYRSSYTEKFKWKCGVSIMSEEIKKGSNYRKKIVEAAKLIPGHPIHHIDMQAHHLLSEAAIKKTKLGKDLVNLGYEIDDILNLVLLPCNTVDACHMRVQLHRGDHKSVDLSDGLRILVALI